MDNQTDKFYQTIVSKIDHLGKKWKLMFVMNGFFNWINGLALLIVVELIIDRILPLPRSVRMAMVIAWCAWAIWLGYRYLLTQFLKDTSPGKIAAYIEEAYPGSENRLQSALQLGKELDRNIYGYSISFIKKLIEQAHETILDVDETLIFYQEHRSLKRSSVAMLIGLILFAGASWLMPGALNNLAHAFVRLPQAPVELVVPKISNVQPGNCTIKSGEDVSISAEVTGVIGSKALLNYRYKRVKRQVGQGVKGADETWKSLQMIAEQNSQKQIVLLKNITRSFEYYISVKNLQSPRYQVTVAHEPIVSNFQLTLSYPAYTGLSPQTLEPNMGDVSALIGTSVKFEGQSSKPLTSASLVFSESDRGKLEIADDGVSVFGKFTVEKSQRYHVLLADLTGASNSHPIEYKIDAISDEPPFVEILSPGMDSVLDDSMRLDLEINSTDDYGVDKIRLVFRIEGRKSGDKTFVTIEELRKPEESLVVQYAWNLSPLDLFTEDVVSYHVEALDADNISGPNVGRSKTYTVRFPSIEEFYQELEADQHAQKEGMESLLDQQDEARDSVEDLIDKIRKSQELTRKEEQELERVLNNQKEIGEKAQKLAEQIQETAKDVQKKQLFDTETLQKYQELQELMEKALTEEQKDVMKKLNEAMQKQSLTDKEKDLMSANFDQKKFQQRLEQMIELYKKMLVQQKVEAAANKAKELAERQKKVIEKLALEQSKGMEEQEGKNLDDLSKHEKDVGDDLENLEKDLDQMADELGKDEKYEDVSGEISGLSKQSKDQENVQKLKKASENMTQGQLNESMQNATQAQSGLDMLADQLNNVVEFMRGQEANEAVAAIRKAIREGLYISQTHEKVLQETQNANLNSRGRSIRSKRERIHKLASDELRLAEGLSLLANRLWELSKGQAQISPKIVWTLNSSKDAMERSARALEDQKPNLALPIQRQALAHVNETIVKLLETLQNMNQQMSMSGLENMFEQLQQLIQNQGQLNETTKRLGQQMRRQGQTPGMEQMLKRMASEQSMIREATERLAEKMEKLSEALGDLREVAKEMEDVEAELRKGNVNRELMEKQRRILTRMLESSKSLQKRQLSKKRKGETAEQVFAETDAADELNPELIEQVKKIQNELRSDGAENWPEGYRELLFKYYKALSKKTR